jgi:hypothetical protein
MLVDGGRFQYRAWADLLGESAAGLVGEAICPFGFEVFRDPTFAAVVPRRFYVLVAPRPGWAGDADELAEQCLDRIRALVARRDPTFAESFAVLRWNGKWTKRLRGEGYACRPTDRLLSVQVREGAGSALEDYARYLVCVLGGVERRTLGELVRFESDTRARRRFFQLFAMLDHLVARVAPAVGPPSSVYGLGQPEEFQQFYDGHLVTPPLPAELELLKRVALPRLEALLAAVRPRPDAPSLRLEARDLYTPARLQVDVDADLGAALVTEAKASLAAFTSPSVIASGK